jgi:hypothetical protein
MYEIQLRKTANGTSPSSTIREQSLVSEARDDFFIESFNDFGGRIYEGHGLPPTVIRAYRENAERNAMLLRMHAPVSMPSAAFDDKRLIDLFYHYAGPAAAAAEAMTSYEWKASISAVMPTLRSPTSSRRDIRTISGLGISTRR